MSRGSRRATALVACALVATASCGCKLRRPPETGQLTEEALPNENEIPDDWAAGVEDDGYVDDGWIASFDDPKLVDLAAEAKFAEIIEQPGTGSRPPRSSRPSGSEPMRGAGSRPGNTKARTCSPVRRTARR